MSRFDQLFQATRSRKQSDQPESPESAAKPSAAEVPVQRKKAKSAQSPQKKTKPAEVSPPETKTLAKHRNPDYVCTSIYLPKRLHRKLRATAIQEDMEMSSIIENLVRNWLEARKHLDI